MKLSDLILPFLSVTPGWSSEDTGLDDADVVAIVEEAEGLAGDRLDPLAARADIEGCVIDHGRVRTPAGYADAYADLGANGWIAPDLPEDLGGQELPLALQAAVGLTFDGAALPFMMAASASRAAAHCLATHAPDLAAVWAPKLAAGEWTASICISEPDAGSDVARIRTRADARGRFWIVSGTKCWISFGDHDMTGRIGHLLLARTGPPEDGTRGLSLFLVPNTTEDGSPNGITVQRVEEKLGLHGSPTCVLGFQDARAELVGTVGRGLQQIFTMIELMRLQTAGQGAGLALRACGIARDYATDRRQGGPADAPAVPIATHPDVLRQVTAIETEASLTTLLVLDLAVTLDAARAGNAAAARRAGFLLPLAKTFCGEAAFRVASGAMQVLGGAGYTREWTVERMLRDARVLTIYEGTTGMQAQDFLYRRLIRDQGAGLEAYSAAARADLARCPDPDSAVRVERMLDRFEALAARISARTDDTEQTALTADNYARAGWEVVSAVLACRLVALGGDHATRGWYWLHAAPERLNLAEANCRLHPGHIV